MLNSKITFPIYEKYFSLSKLKFGIAVTYEPLGTSAITLARRLLQDKWAHSIPRPQRIAILTGQCGQSAGRITEIQKFTNKSKISPTCAGMAMLGLQQCDHVNQ